MKLSQMLSILGWFSFFWVSWSIVFRWIQADALSFSFLAMFLVIAFLASVTTAYPKK